jgi:hypothetical protein
MDSPTARHRMNHQLFSVITMCLVLLLFDRLLFSKTPFVSYVTFRGLILCARHTVDTDFSGCLFHFLQKSHLPVGFGGIDKLPGRRY